MKDFGNDKNPVNRILVPLQEVSDHAQSNSTGGLLKIVVKATFVQKYLLKIVVKTTFVGKQARKPQSYASSKLCPLTDLLTGVRCRATSVAKKHLR